MAKRTFPQSRGAQMVALARSSKEDDGNFIRFFLTIMPISLELKSESNKIVRLDLSGREQAQHGENLIKKLCMDERLLKQINGKKKSCVLYNLSVIQTQNIHLHLFQLQTSVLLQQPTLSGILTKS